MSCGRLAISAIIDLFTMSAKFKLFLLIGALANAFLLLGVSSFLLQQPITPEDEYLVIKLTSALKNIGLGLDEKPPQKDFLFVNVAYAKALVPKYDESGVFPIGNEAITDRAKLASLFQKLNKHPQSYQYIICDIHFTGASEDDSILAEHIEKTENIIASYHYNKAKKQYEDPVFKVHKGLADYTEHKESFLKKSEGFLKYRLLLNDSVKSLPLLMYQDLSGASWQKDGWFYELNGKPIFNSFILNFRIRSYDLFESKKPYPTLTIDDLLLMDAETMASFVKDRIIVIGDFTDRDLHDTIYGKMPGSLILVNAYLALLNEDNLMRNGLLVVLFISFTLLTLLALYPQKFIKNWFVSALNIKTQWIKYLFDFMAYFILLAAISIGSFFLYNIHLNVFFLALEIHFIGRIALFTYKKLGIVEEDNNLR